MSRQGATALSIRGQRRAWVHLPAMFEDVLDGISSKLSKVELVSGSQERGGSHLVQVKAALSLPE